MFAYIASSPPTPNPHEDPYVDNPVGFIRLPQNVTAGNSSMPTVDFSGGITIEFIVYESAMRQNASYPAVFSWREDDSTWNSGGSAKGMVLGHSFNYSPNETTEIKRLEASFQTGVSQLTQRTASKAAGIWTSEYQAGWHHYMVVDDDTNLKIIRDGRVTTGVSNSTLSNMTSFSAPIGFAMGRRVGGSGRNLYTASNKITPDVDIALCRVYNSAISDQDCQDQYNEWLNNGTKTKIPSETPVFECLFQELESADVITEENGNHQTVFRYTSSSISNPWNEDGLIDLSAEFDYHLDAPADSATDIPGRPYLCVTGHVGDGSSPYYRFEVATNSSFTTGVIDTGWRWLKPWVDQSDSINLDPSTTYYWRASAKNTPSGTPTVLATRSFTTRAAQNWYVRPRGTNTGTDNNAFGTSTGLSYANAFRGMTNVYQAESATSSWDNGQPWLQHPGYASPGDSIYFCGTWIKNTSNATYDTINMHGWKGTASNYIKFRTDDATNPGQFVGNKIIGSFSSAGGGVYTLVTSTRPASLWFTSTSDDRFDVRLTPGLSTTPSEGEFHVRSGVLYVHAPGGVDPSNLLAYVGASVNSGETISQSFTDLGGGIWQADLSVTPVLKVGAAFFSTLDDGTFDRNLTRVHALPLTVEGTCYQNNAYSFTVYPPGGADPQGQIRTSIANNQDPFYIGPNNQYVELTIHAYCTNSIGYDGADGSSAKMFTRNDGAGFVSQYIRYKDCVTRGLARDVVTFGGPSDNWEFIDLDCEWMQNGPYPGGYDGDSAGSGPAIGPSYFTVEGGNYGYPGRDEFYTGRDGHCLGCQHGTNNSIIASANGPARCYEAGMAAVEFWSSPTSGRTIGDYFIDGLVIVGSGKNSNAIWGHGLAFSGGGDYSSVTCLPITVRNLIVIDSDNTASGAGANAIHMSRPHDFKIDHVTLSNTQYSGSYMISDGSNQSHDITVRNSLFINPTGGFIFFNAASTKSADGNTYIGNSGSKFNNGGGTINYTSWQSAGHDANGQLGSSTDVVDDTGLTETDTNLASGSACIDFGVDLGVDEPATDYLGTARSGYPNNDCGAHEFV